MRSPRARQERLDRLKKFINAHCVRNMVGVHRESSPKKTFTSNQRKNPLLTTHCHKQTKKKNQAFFNSLCAVLHLMSLPARKSGSGKRRVEWEIDLALFCEAGGEPFLVDSIQFLKGVRQSLRTSLPPPFFLCVCFLTSYLLKCSGTRVRGPSEASCGVLTTDVVCDEHEHV
jgi:hypothetical protein